jgi:Tfp pilus assembly protein PilF
LEPDLADNYEELGVLYSREQKDEEAEKAFQKALMLDAKLGAAHLGLAKLYFKEKKFEPALKASDMALKYDPSSNGIHYIRARIFSQLGRKEDADNEFEQAKKKIDTKLDQQRELTEQQQVADPELKQQPQ